MIWLQIVVCCFLLSAPFELNAQGIKIRDLPAAGAVNGTDMIPSALTGGTTNKLTIDQLFGHYTISCTAPLLCNSTTSALLSSNPTFSLAAYYVPLTGATFTQTTGGAIRFLSASSTASSAQVYGLRTSMFNLFDNVGSNVDSAAMRIDFLQDSNPTSATIKRTGLHIVGYTMPDNGGDTSAILATQTGGGCGICVYKTSLLRPIGETDYSSSLQGAIEGGTSDQSQAILGISGMQTFGANTNSSASAWFRIDNAQSYGVVIGPNNNTFDSRIALVVGTKQTNAVPVNQTFKVLMNGNVSTPGTFLASNFSGSSSGTNTGDAYAGFVDAGTTINTITATDKVGVGTSSPDSLITISSNSTTPPAPLSNTVFHLLAADSTGTIGQFDVFGSSDTIALRRANGTNASKSALAAGDVVGNIASYGYGATGYGSTPFAAIRTEPDEAFSDTAQGGRIELHTANLTTTTLTKRLTIDGRGHFVYAGTAPSVACAGTGTSPAAPTLGTGSTDERFIVTVNTGTSPANTGTCTITFASAYLTNNPVIVCTLVSGASTWGNTATLQLTTESLSAPVFTWTNSVAGVLTALTGSSSYKFACHVDGK